MQLETFAAISFTLAASMFFSMARALLAWLFRVATGRPLRR